MATEITTLTTNIKSEIQKCLNDAKKSIRVCMAYFTDRDLLNTLKSQANLIDVQLIVDINDNNEPLLNENKKQGCLQNEISIFSIDVPGKGSMHHKFCVIDGHTVITGSFNWTENANRNNYENIVIIKKDSVNAAVFLAEFVRLRGIAKQNAPEQDIETEYDQFNYQIPQILGFGASSNVIKKGNEAEIFWSVKNAISVEITGIDEVLPLVGQIHLFLNRTTHFTLTAYNEIGERVMQVMSVEITEPIVPSICHFVSDKQIVMQGEEVFLYWSVADADEVILVQLPFNEADLSRKISCERVNSKGNYSFSLETDASFCLVATNGDQKVSAFIHLQAVVVPKLDFPKIQESFPCPPADQIPNLSDVLQRAPLPSLSTLSGIERLVEAPQDIIINSLEGGPLQQIFQQIFFSNGKNSTNEF